MGNPQEDVITKTITTTGDLDTGGRLNRAQQDEFVKMVKDFAVILPRVRFKAMPVSRVSIDKMYVGQPVTRPTGENVNQSVNGRALFGQLLLDASKFRSDWSISTETLQENIEGSAFDDTMMELMTKRISTDVELLCVQGDSTAVTTNPTDLLLSGFDGWDKLTDDVHIIDAAGAGISREILADARRKMPEQFAGDPDLMWVGPNGVAIDWLEYIAQRETTGGDDALFGRSMSPLGIPWLSVPSIPTRKPLSVSVATPAQIEARNFGPYKIIAGANDQMNLTINGVASPGDVTLLPGVYTALEMATEIRRALVAIGGTGPSVAAGLSLYDNGDGQLVIERTVTGVAATIVVANPAADPVYDEWGGVVAGTFTGQDAANGTINEGTFLWLINPKNLVFGMVDETRIYNRFNPDFDRWETILYHQLAVNVEEKDAIVKVINLRVGG